MAAFPAYRSASTTKKKAGQRVVNKAIAKRIKTLWAYPEIGEPTRVTLLSVKFDTYYGCEQGESIEVSSATEGLLSSIRLRRHADNRDQSPDSAAVRAGRRLLKEVLAKARVSAAWQARVQGAAAIHPVRLRSGGQDSLVITASDEWKERSISIFLIAELRTDGHYGITEESVQLGSASDSEGYAGRVEYLVHADVNGDGVDEVFIARQAYETFDTSALMWDGKKWERVASAGGGC